MKSVGGFILNAFKNCDKEGFPNLATFDILGYMILSSLELSCAWSDG